VTTTHPVAPSRVWATAVASFAPAHHRVRAARLARHLPLTAILLVQALMALKLSNTAFQDEALYVHTGHLITGSWSGGDPVYLHPDDFFSGAPMLYPVFASVLDGIGGLWLARLFSLVCMLAATVCICWLTNTVSRRPAGSAPGILAALVFGWSAPVVFLSNFATFDAASFALIAAGTAVGAWAATSGVKWRWWVLMGALLALAVFIKYGSVIDVPFAYLVALVAGGRPTPGLVARWVLAIVAFVAVVAGSLLTWASPLTTGIARTTTERAPLDPASTGELVRFLIPISAITFLLAAIGGVVLLRSRPVLAVTLLGGTFAATASQVRMGELVSIHKHVVLGFIFAAPLAGMVLARVVAAIPGAVTVVGACWLIAVFGMQQSQKLFDMWPNSSLLVRQLEYSVHAMPWIRMVGEMPEPVQYAMQDQLKQWQVTATYEGSFTYKGQTGVPAYQAALRDNYFQLVFLDGSTPIGRALNPAAEGFKLTSTVATPYTGHAWHIFQRFDNIPSG